MAAPLLCTEAAQRKFPSLLVPLVGGLSIRKYSCVERRANSKWVRIIHGPKIASQYLGCKDMILPEVFINKNSASRKMYSVQCFRYPEPHKTFYWAYDSFSRTASASRFHSLQRGIVNNGLQVWPQTFRKLKGRNGPPACYYCSVRRDSDSVKQRVVEENKRTRERFAACEKEWEKLVDESLLKPEELEIHEAHRLAVAQGHFTYDDPHTGNRVMTRLRHFLRGSCCGNACRHCVYNHGNVAEKERSQRVFNSSFWVDGSTRPELAAVSARISDMKTSASFSIGDKMKISKQEASEPSDPLLYKN